MRRRLTRVILAALAAAAYAIGPAATTASAAGIGLFSGSATFAPALTLVSTVQFGTLTGTATGLFETSTAPVTCSFTFTVTGTIVVATGTGAGGCSNSSVSASPCNVNVAVAGTTGKFDLTGECFVAMTPRTFTLSMAGPPMISPGTNYSGLGLLNWAP